MASTAFEGIEESYYEVRHRPQALSAFHMAHGLESSTNEAQNSNGGTFLEEEEEEPFIRKYNPNIDHVEEIENYQPGGLHPLQIGDELDGGKFTIVHKLGYGGF